MTDTSRLFAAMQQSHRAEVGKLALQCALYRDQLVSAGIVPADRQDDELLRLWRAAANSVSAASAFVAELGTGKELLDPNMTVRHLRRAS